MALGTLQPDGTFRASEVLAKHDETYMPKDVGEALKKSGHWNPDAGPPPPAATWNTLVPKTEAPKTEASSDEAGRMIPELGHFALAMAVALAVAQAVLPLWGAHAARRAADGGRAGAGAGPVDRAGRVLSVPGAGAR